MLSRCSCPNPSRDITDGAPRLHHPTHKDSSVSCPRSSRPVFPFHMILKLPESAR